MKQVCKVAGFKMLTAHERFFIFGRVITCHAPRVPVPGRLCGDLKRCRFFFWHASCKACVRAFPGQIKPRSVLSMLTPQASHCRLDSPPPCEASATRSVLRALARSVLRPIGVLEKPRHQPPARSSGLFDHRGHGPSKVRSPEGPEHAEQVFRLLGATSATLRGRARARPLPHDGHH